MIRITPDPIDLNAVHALLDSPRAGAILVFTGIVRDHNQGRGVTGLSYEAYAEMAEKQMEAIAEAMRQRWPLEQIVMVHRIGDLAIGDVAVVVGVSSGHRAEAFEACRYGIDTLKAEVPIWKKEHFDAGSEWLENPEACRS